MNTLMKYLTKYRIVERKDKKGNFYYAVESKFLFGKWKWVESECQIDRHVGMINYDILTRNVRFSDIESAKEYVIRLFKATNHIVFEIRPILYIDYSDRFMSQAWYVPMELFDNADNYFYFATHSYETIEDTKRAIDNWMKEKQDEEREASMRENYKKVVYKF